MKKFNIGDLVIGNKDATKRYRHTVTGWVGVVYGYHHDNILVDAVSQIPDPDDGLLYSKGFSVQTEYFEPYEMFPEDVPYSWDFVKT